MRIAVVLDRLEPQRGGAEQVIHSIMEQWVAEGHDVDVLFWLGDGTAPEGINVHRIGVPGASRAIRILAFSRRVQAYLKKERYDATINLGCGLGTDVHWPHGGVHRAMRRAASRGFIHKWAAALLPREWALNALENARYQNPSRPLHYIAVSHQVATDMKKAGASPEKVHVVPNGVDVSLFTPEGEISTAFPTGPMNDRPLGLFVAHHLELKGIMPLIEAVGNLKDIHIAVCGGTPGRKIRSHLARVGVADRFTWLGPVDDVRPFYRACDLLVHPTLYDPCSLVTLESWAMDKPVVTTTMNGAIELDPDRKATVVVAPGDSEALACGIEDVLNCRNEGVYQPRNVAKEASLETAARRIIDVLKTSRSSAEEVAA